MATGNCWFFYSFRQYSGDWNSSCFISFTVSGRNSPVAEPLCNMQPKMRIISSYRKEYFHRSVFLTIVLTLVFGATFHSQNPDNLLWQIILLWISALSISVIIIFLIHAIVDRNQIRIEVTSEGIFVYQFLKSKPKCIKFEEIISYKTRRIKLHSHTVPISDGSLETTFKLKDGNEFIINQDKYKNYTEIARAITQNLNLHVA